MEGPSVKRRRLEQEECVAQGFSANDCDVGAEPLTDPLPESTVLATHRHNVLFGMVSFIFNICLINHTH